MWFNIFKHKKKVEEPKTFEGKFISEEELNEMVRPKKDNFIKKEMTEINEMMDKVKQYFE